MKITSEHFSENLDQFDISTWEIGVGSENSLGFIRLLSFEAPNRELFDQWESAEYLQLEQDICALFFEINQAYPMLEIAYPKFKEDPLKIAPGLYPFKSEENLKEYLINGIQEALWLQVFLPDLKLLIEAGHDFCFNISYHGSRRPRQEEVNYLKRLIETHHLVLSQE